MTLENPINLPNSIIKRVLQALPLLSLLAFWEWAVSLDKTYKFLFGSPSDILQHIFTKVLDGSILVDAGVTAIEAILGFLIGTLVGSFIGLSLWSSKIVFELSKPYIVILGSAPIFALAPILIIWFGTGLFAKVMMAALSTVFVALSQAYRGASVVSKEQILLLDSFGATKFQVFRKVIVPSALVWVMSAFKLNIGFALLGAFMGEYISSEYGLGHLILVASGLYNVSLVMVGVIFLMAIGLILDFILTQLEAPLKRFIVKTF